MRKLHFLFYPLIATSIFWCSCETENAEDVNQDRIKTYYYLEYDAINDETTARAQFVFGSTYLNLTDPSTIFFNEVELIKSEILGLVQYSKSFNGIVELGTFEYINSESKSFTNQTVLPAAIEIPEDFTTYSKSERPLLTWSGSKLNPFETVTVRIKIQGTEFSFFTTAINSTAIELSPNTSIPIGLGTIEIERSIERNASDAPNAGGTIKSTYRSAAYTLTIIQ